MSDDSPIREYLEEILESGRSPEQVCADSPEFLDEIRHRLQKFDTIKAQVEDLFPLSSAAILDEERYRLHDSLAPLPHIPDYDVQCLLGHGGMGVVYKARHLKLNRPVAVKMLLSGNYASPTERTRFLREAEAVARLSHPNVVQLHDMGECDGRAYFTMEFVEGETLVAKLTGAPWPIERAVKLMETLAGAVNAAHKAGIVHRDLKPSNILLGNDGTPKISDFGLARRVDDDSNVTLSGVRMGTPCYMSPEQAMGRANLVGPATDVYSLGAILYELLTGRPPFRGESSAETERLLIHQEPVPPRRLNTKVPRDLETICLKCLGKEPEGGCSSAGELAQDLGRFLRDEPITARRTGLIERTYKWAHRHPVITVVAAAAVLLAILVVSDSIRIVMQRTQAARAVDGDLQAVSILQTQERWAEAQGALRRAVAVAQANPSPSLQRRCDQSARNLALATTLDQIRLSRSTSGALMVYRNLADQRYRQAFADVHLGTYHDSPGTVAKRVEASAVRPELLAALDDWALCAVEPAERGWVLAVTQLADPDPLGWNARILDPARWNDSKALVELANSVPAEKVSLPVLLVLAECLTVNGGPSAPYLNRVQHQYPDDFWVNLVMGNALLMRSPAEAREYYRVAIARRPDAPVGYCAVGDTFRLQNRLDEAFAYYRKSIELDPNYARGYSNIGLNYQAARDYPTAIQYFHKSLELDPQYAWSYYNLGTTFEWQGHADQALDAYRKALALEPNSTLLINAVHREQEPHDYGWPAWRDKIKTNPSNFDDWWGYPELTLFLGKIDEYRAARQALLKEFGDSTDPMITEKIGRACLMMPATPEETSIAAALIQRTADARDSVDPSLHSYFVFAQGLAAYRQGDWDRVIAIMQHNAPTGLGPSPQLILSMALYQQGKHEAALKTLAAAVTTMDWRPFRATKRDIWMTHILRREAEAMILPNIPAFLAGKYQPHENNERLALLGICEFNLLYGTEAKLLADAFEADAKLASDFRNGLRFRAACAAASASAGRGMDAHTLGAAARAGWHDQAITWLRDDLSAMSTSLKQQPATSRNSVIKSLARWQTNRDLATIHDDTALWSNVAATLDLAQSQATSGQEVESVAQ